MTYKDVINQKKADFDKIFDFFKSDIATIRTGRANPAMVEDIEVDYYNQKYRIKEILRVSPSPWKMHRSAISFQPV